MHFLSNILMYSQMTPSVLQLQKMRVKAQQYILHVMKYLSDGHASKYNKYTTAILYERMYRNECRQLIFRIQTEADSWLEIDPIQTMPYNVFASPRASLWPSS